MGSIARGTGLLAGWGRRVQTGLVRTYALAFLAGVVGVLWFLVGKVDVNGFPWLTVVTFLPLAGAVVLLALPARSRTAIRWWALAVTLATFGVAVGMLLSFHAGRAGYQMVEQASWVGILGFRYVLGVDGISVFMVVLTAFLMPLAVLASWHVERSPKTYFFAFLFLETATIGAFVALDLLLFFVFFEGLLFPMYLIIGGWGGRRRAYAAMKFFIYTMAGSAFLLLGILFLAFRADAVLGHQTLDVRQLAALPLPVTTARWLFLAFLLAFAVKVPLVPVHTWLPDAYVEAPTAGTLVLSALLAKVGAYGLIRFNLSLFPEASVHFRDLVLVLGVLAILYGAVVAAVQSDAKRLIAYSSVSHLGFVVLGTFALSTQALSGSVLYMVNHALSTGALFLLVGMLAERVGTRDVRRMGGLANRMPVLMGLFLFCALASIGLPGLNNFVSEFLVILGTFITRSRTRSPRRPRWCSRPSTCCGRTSAWRTGRRRSPARRRGTGRARRSTTGCPPATATGPASGT